MVKLEKRKMPKKFRVSIIDLPVAIDAVSAFARKGIQIFDIQQDIKLFNIRIHCQRTFVYLRMVPVKIYLNKMDRSN